MKECPRCKGVGWRVLIVGPHVVDGGIGVPGGPARYDCRLCRGKGKVTNKAAAAELKARQTT